MKASLSEEQRQAIQQNGGLPLEIADPQTNQVFFLISAEQYERARGEEGGRARLRNP